jgi:hypothetical protein
MRSPDTAAGAPAGLSAIRRPEDIRGADGPRVPVVEGVDLEQVGVGASIGDRPVRTRIRRTQHLTATSRPSGGAIGELDAHQLVTARSGGPRDVTDAVDGCRDGLGRGCHPDARNNEAKQDGGEGGQAQAASHHDQETPRSKPWLA